MSVFQNMRTRCLSKSWPSFFVRSGGKFASAFIDLRGVFTGDLPGDAGLIEKHGSPEAVGGSLRRELISLGLMQDGPGAPKGNANARAENREKTAKIEAEAKRKVMEVVAGGKKRLAAQKILAVPRVQSVTATTKFLDGKAVSGVKRKSEAIGVAEMQVQSAIDRVVESTKALDVVIKRSHHKKTSDAEILKSLEKPSIAAQIVDAFAPAKRSHHKKKVA